MALPQSELRLSPDEYLAFERAFQNGRHEYQDGRLYAMAGESPSHGRIKSNLVREIGLQLKGRDCDVFTADMKVGISLAGPFYYPDVVIVCGRLIFRDQEKDVLLNPHTIIEVLSPSTEGFDRGGRFEQYRKNQSLTTYVVVAQDRPQVTVLVRQPNQHWDLSMLTEPDSVLVLEKLQCRVPLSDVYSRVEFPAAESAEPAPAPKKKTVRRKSRRS